MQLVGELKAKITQLEADNSTLEAELQAKQAGEAALRMCA